MKSEQLIYALVIVSLIAVAGLFVYDRLSSPAPAIRPPAATTPSRPPPAPSVTEVEARDAAPIGFRAPATAADVEEPPICPWQSSHPSSRADARASERLAREAFNLLNRGQNRPAADVAARALALDSRSSRAWITLGAARESLGDRDGAEQAFRCCMSQGTGRFVPECERMLRSP